MTDREIIRFIRKTVCETNTTQVALADKAGINHRTVNNALNYIHVPKLDTTVKMLKGLGYKLEVTKI